MEKGAQNARELSLLAAGFLLNSEGKLYTDADGEYMRIEPKISELIQGERWEKRDDFQVVPASLLEPSGWKSKQSGPWNSRS